MSEKPIFEGRFLSLTTKTILKEALNDERVALQALGILAERKDEDAIEAIRRIGCAYGEEVALRALEILRERKYDYVDDKVYAIGYKHGGKVALEALEILNENWDDVITPSFIDDIMYEYGGEVAKKSLDILKEHKGRGVTVLIGKIGIECPELKNQVNDILLDRVTKKNG
ncbi:MAG: hypothetical protein OEY94_06395 [Alphaproteobacteria bacterium]|nr:hypothetical protein [Alphaproteobacteria bacterium]